MGKLGSEKEIAELLGFCDKLNIENQVRIEVFTFTVLITL